MSTTPSDAVLLDLDGTLSDNYPGISASIVHALAQLGEPAPQAAALRACVGPPLRESFARLLGTSDRLRIELALGFYRDRFRDLGWRENVVYPGVSDALPVLAERARLFVCTAKPEVFAIRIVAHFGFDACIERVYGADLDGVYDDKRKLLALLLERERLDPAHCTMVGDRHHDIRAARATGTRAVGVLWGYGSAEELAGADALADTPAALPSVVARTVRLPAAGG
jgi:phosphoglycolate phosphatase